MKDTAALLAEVSETLLTELTDAFRRPGADDAIMVFRFPEAGGDRPLYSAVFATQKHALDMIRDFLTEGGRPAGILVMVPERYRVGCLR
jgi:hypothetical protein